ncbi:hypothetical protein L4D76_19610 [Photobacterium sagamiensis]|uniref:hypothetical protein n=1 Tax=Photobacterium sagamiensis TaxID=2910241 RepID=UPI003D0AE598
MVIFTGSCGLAKFVNQAQPGKDILMVIVLGNKPGLFDQVSFTVSPGRYGSFGSVCL